MEARIQVLEARLGKSDTDLISRMNKLSFPVDDFEDLWAKVDPGTALTYETKVVAPILYRRQEILAVKDQLKQNIKQVSEILKLISIGQQVEKKITESQVAQAPILTSETMDTTRLEKLEETLFQLQTRCNEASDRLDRMITNYSNFVTAVSEKLVAMQEN